MAETLQVVPQTVDVLMWAGDSFRLIMEVKDSQGRPQDLTGYQFAAAVARNCCDPVAEFEVIYPNESPYFHVWLVLPEAQSAALPRRYGDGKLFRGFWDVEVICPDGTVKTIVSGRFNVHVDIARC